MNKDLNVEREILIYAFRYALGRMTFAPDTVMDNIKANMDSLPTEDLELYIREIDDCHRFGAEVDKKQWIVFKQYLEEEVQKRNKTA